MPIKTGPIKGGQDLSLEIVSVYRTEYNTRMHEMSVGEGTTGLDNHNSFFASVVANDF